MGGSGGVASANGVARQFDVEPFRVFAHGELVAAAPWVPGVCFNPTCSRDFDPAVPWQVYCCRACERAGLAELRRVGHKAALPLLCHRLGKYSANPGERDLAAAARRYIGQLQTAWLQDRRSRAEAARGA